MDCSRFQGATFFVYFASPKTHMYQKVPNGLGGNWV